MHYTYVLGLVLLGAPVRTFYTSKTALSFAESDSSELSLKDETMEKAIKAFILANLTQPRLLRVSPQQSLPECICVPYFLCKDGVITTTGEGLVDIRGRMSLPVNGNCSDALDVCCLPPPDIMLETSTISGTIAKGSLDPEIAKERCGVRPLLEKVDGNIDMRSALKSNLSALGEFPWMTAVLRTQVKKDPLTNENAKIHVFVCGGSLVHEFAVMTAAHCVDRIDAANLQVRLGEWDTQNINEIYEHIDKNVRKIVIKRDYYRGTLFNDVALLILAEPVKFASHILPVCLPKPDTSYVGATCTATGWGKDQFGMEGRYSNILKKVELPVISRRTCEDALKTTRLGPYFRLHQSFLCAGGLSGEDTCKGDGGSPLVCYDPHLSVYVQVGIVSWGISCGETHIPGVYADVIHLGDWIRQTLAQEATLG